MNILYPEEHNKRLMVETYGESYNQVGFSYDAPPTGAEPPPPPTYAPTADDEPYIPPGDFIVPENVVLVSSANLW